MCIFITTQEGKTAYDVSKTEEMKALLLQVSIDILLYFMLLSGETLLRVMLYYVMCVCVVIHTGTCSTKTNITSGRD